MLKSSTASIDDQLNDKKTDRSIVKVVHRVNFSRQLQVVALLVKGVAKKEMIIFIRLLKSTLMFSMADLGNCNVSMHSDSFWENKNINFIRCVVLFKTGFTLQSSEVKSSAGVSI